MVIETIEGDYVIKGGPGKDLLRVHFTAESMIITVKNYGVVVCDIPEAKELRDWLTRRLEEDIG